MPSSTINGAFNWSLLAADRAALYGTASGDKDLFPRIRIWPVAPGFELLLTISTPASRPFNSVTKFAVGTSFRVDSPTEAIAPVTSLRFREPYPTTIT